MSCWIDSPTNDARTARAPAASEAPSSRIHASGADMIVLDDAQIQELMDPVALVEALREAFLNPGETPARLHRDLPGEDGDKLLVMPCWSGRAVIGVKVVTVIPANASRGRPTIDGTYLLMDGQTGRPLAVLSAPALTALRTAGVCALAASRLARPGARSLLMIGTGALAPHLVKAYVETIGVETVVLWGRDGLKARALARRLAGLPVELTVADSLSPALAAADIICSATLSAAPLIEGRKVAPGTHIDLVGGFTPEMREADTHLIQRARVFVDTKTALEESGDLIGPLRDGVITLAVPDLTELLTLPELGRKDDEDITVFKTVGTGLADLAAARLILALANGEPANEIRSDHIPVAIG